MLALSCTVFYKHLNKEGMLFFVSHIVYLRVYKFAAEGIKTEFWHFFSCQNILLLQNIGNCGVSCEKSFLFIAR